jgi:hypothetical protein
MISACGCPDKGRRLTRPADRPALGSAVRRRQLGIGDFLMPVGRAPERRSSCRRDGLVSHGRRRLTPGDGARRAPVTTWENVFLFHAVSATPLPFLFEAFGRDGACFALGSWASAPDVPPARRASVSTRHARPCSRWILPSGDTPADAYATTHRKPSEARELWGVEGREAHPRDDRPLAWTAPRRGSLVSAAVSTSKAIRGPAGPGATSARTSSSSNEPATSIALP